MAKIIPYACIDIGTASVRMVIAESSAQATRVLDRAYRNIAVGHDTFSLGSIQSDTVDAICECLRNYRQLLREYDVSRFRVVATSALRDAQNRDYVLDRIRVRTGLDVQVLGPSEEHFIWLKSLAATFPDYMAMRKSGCMIVNIGLGTVQISVIQNGEMKMSRQLPFGALKFWEIFAGAGRGPASRAEMMESFIDSSSNYLLHLRNWTHLRHCVFLCNEAEFLQNLFGMHEAVIHEKNLDLLYESFRDYLPERLAADRDITLMQAQFALPTLLLMKYFFDLTGAERLHMPVATLPDGMIVHLSDKAFKTKRLFPFEDDILSVCRGLAKDFQSDMAHIGHVEKTAVRIFEDTRRLHGLRDRDMLLLRIAAILHMSGNFVSSDASGELAAQLTRAAQIIGLTDLETRICAFLVQFASDELPSIQQQERSGLREKRRVQAAKLLAILRIADALDFSRAQHITGVHVAEKQDDLALHAKASGNTHMEEWMFGLRAPFFHEVFGVSLDLKVGRVW